MVVGDTLLAKYTRLQSIAAVLLRRLAQNIPDAHQGIAPCRFSRGLMLLMLIQ
jgi:hypothetical protein